MKMSDAFNMTQEEFDKIEREFRKMFDLVIKIEDSVVGLQEVFKQILSQKEDSFTIEIDSDQFNFNKQDSLEFDRLRNSLFVLLLNKGLIQMINHDSNQPTIQSWIDIFSVSYPDYFKIRSINDNVNEY